MFYRSLLFATVVAGVASLPAPAHDVQTADNVGATLHIEPNDIPLAGAPTEVWFALTQAGGTVIPLADCECRLAVYDAQDTVLATPNLTALSAEGYTNIPGAVLQFPEVGAYELMLTGEPKNDAVFSSFELRFDVTVAQSAKDTTVTTEENTAPATPTPEASDVPADANSTSIQSTETSTSTSTSRAWYLPLIWGGALLIAGFVWRVMHNSQSPGDES